MVVLTDGPGVGEGRSESPDLSPPQEGNRQGTRGTEGSSQKIVLVTRDPSSLPFRAGGDQRLETGPRHLDDSAQVFRGLSLVDLDSDRGPGRGEDRRRRGSKSNRPRGRTHALYETRKRYSADPQNVVKGPLVSSFSPKGLLG